MAGPERLLEPILSIHERIRAAAVDACARAATEQLAAVAADAPDVAGGDTIYAIDRLGEDSVVQGLTELAREEPLCLVAEGLPGDSVVLPPDARETDCRWRLLVDPIDGTRGLMYQKRSAWILTGIAPNRGAETRLRDIVLAVQTEIPLVKQHLADQLWALRGRGIEARRFNRLSGAREPVTLRPSRADTIAHGFATVVRFFPGAREESHDGRETVRDGVRPRGSERDRLPRAGKAIEPPRLDPPPAECPELIRKMLLDQRNLGLHGEHDVTQARLGTAVRRDSGENPGAALLIHQSARAVDRVDQQPPAAILLPRPARQDEDVAGESFGHQTQRLRASELGEALHEGFLGHPVDGVDRVACAAPPCHFGSHGGKLLRSLPRAGVHHGAPDAIVEREDGLEQARGVRHLSRPAYSARSRPPGARPPSPPGQRRSESSRRRSPGRRGA